MKKLRICQLKHLNGIVDMDILDVQILNAKTRRVKCLQFKHLINEEYVLSDYKLERFLHSMLDGKVSSDLINNRLKTAIKDGILTHEDLGAT